MQTVRDTGQLGNALVALRAGGHRVALVPTMGALHAGHMALVEEAQRQADRVVVSIFVNPLQFGANEDLDRYPRQEEEDARRLNQAGCDLLWMPTAQQMYPAGFATTVSVGKLGERWEGEARPGHFDGVATVVAKLLATVRPDVAVFGEKDFQQLAVIRRMATDLALGAAIVGLPTVRDPDGLALSSRNAYLSPQERQQALALPNALRDAAEKIAAGGDVAEALGAARRSLADAGFRTDYFALVDAATLEPISAPAGRMRLIAAATIGTTRLIDNLPLD
ncbi:pantoate--beta-alanine ligase [Sphingomonas sinipercae]|uniref:Pantothenate synthetase n=1 Tax=Sphingomonas sinipercae TaxID=2714944 RepID=A0A6G7ZLS9_9SPHN|nr:pantoate--beta-alanine ligase [Sphingomonas sinipercae]QIL01893.1 pantoate--beta-alanine ligase [Sphingomonas sinipercae]